VSHVVAIISRSNGDTFMKFYSEYYNILIINCAKFHAAVTFSFFVIKERPRLIGRPSYNVAYYDFERCSIDLVENVIIGNSI